MPNLPGKSAETHAHPTPLLSGNLSVVVYGRFRLNAWLGQHSNLAARLMIGNSCHRCTAVHRAAAAWAAPSLFVS